MSLQISSRTKYHADQNVKKHLNFKNSVLYIPPECKWKRGTLFSIPEYHRNIWSPQGSHLPEDVHWYLFAVFVLQSQDQGMTEGCFSWRSWKYVVTTRSSSALGCPLVSLCHFFAAVSSSRNDRGMVYLKILKISGHHKVLISLRMSIGISLPCLCCIHKIKDWCSGCSCCLIVTLCWTSLLNSVQ